LQDRQSYHQSDSERVGPATKGDLRLGQLRASCRMPDLPQVVVQHGSTDLPLERVGGRLGGALSKDIPHHPIILGMGGKPCGKQECTGSRLGFTSGCSD